MTSLLKELKQTINHWWLFLILGVLLIIGGIFVFTTPIESYISLSIFFSVMIFFNGIFDVVFSISNHKMLKGWGWYLAGGVLEILLGIFLMYYPGITMITLPLILGFWLMYGAVSTISGAFDLKSYHIKGWGWLLLLGILLMIFGFMVIADPIFGSGSVLLFTSLAIIAYGVSYVMFGLKLKKIKEVAKDVKKAVFGGLDDLKKEVLAAIENSADDIRKKDEVGKKFDSFQKSME